MPVAAARRYRVAVRRDLARAYVDGGSRPGVAPSVSRAPSASAEVLRLPDLLEVQERTPDVQRELPSVKRALGLALRAFDGERQREGRHLQRDMLRADGARAPRRGDDAPSGSARHRRAPRAGGGAPGEAARGRQPGRRTRVAHEVALLAERSDLTEELVRLESHLAALAAALRTTGPVGKRIEFLLQEVHRELNTTGAKAQDLALGAAVLEARGEVEKLREQVQNVE